MFALPRFQPGGSSQGTSANPDPEGELRITQKQQLLRKLMKKNAKRKADVTAERQDASGPAVKLNEHSSHKDEEETSSSAKKKKKKRKAKIEEPKGTAKESESPRKRKRKRKDPPLGSENFTKQGATDCEEETTCNNTKEKRDVMHESENENEETDQDAAAGDVDKLRQMLEQLDNEKDNDSDTELNNINIDGEATGEDTIEPLEVPKAARRSGTVRRKLPEWLAQPNMVTSDVHRGFVPTKALENMEEDLESLGLSDRMITAIKKLGLDNLFPIQRALIPVVMKAYESPYHLGDVCVSAPTGSGKTLAYVLPVVACLSTRIVRRLRALVLVPSRELIFQVRKVFSQCCQSVKCRLPLKVGVATGQSSFAKEQRALLEMLPGGKFESAVDILVATPGRLVDHINTADGICLEHVRFLVIDEADRLLTQKYHDWLPAVLRAVTNQPPTDESPADRCRSDFTHHTYRYPLSIRTAAREANMKEPLIKMLFSATLTQDPEKLASLKLINPRLFLASASSKGEASTEAAHTDGNERFSIPSTLTEHMIIVRQETKPLALLHLLQNLKLRKTLIFVSSVENTHRLCLLLQLFNVRVKEFSSALSASARKQIIKEFTADDSMVVVSSDAMARGLDLDQVENVISYDAPVHARTYVHRIGRTARAGLSGTAYTILRKEEARHFKAMRRSISAQLPKSLKLKKEEFAQFSAKYEENLEKLQATLENEKRAHSNNSSSTGTNTTSTIAASQGLLETLHRQMMDRFG